LQRSFNELFAAIVPARAGPGGRCRV